MLRTAIILVATVAMAGCSATADPNRKVIYGVDGYGNAMYRKASEAPKAGAPLMCLRSTGEDGCPSAIDELRADNAG